MGNKEPNRTRFEDRLDKNHDGRFVQLSKRGWNRIPALEYDETKEQPQPEELLLRQALKRLTPKQKQVWEMWNYDKLTQDEIGKTLKITHQMVAKHIKAIEKKIIKYCQQHMEAYNLLKAEMEREEL